VRTNQHAVEAGHTQNFVNGFDARNAFHPFDPWLRRISASDNNCDDKKRTRFNAVFFCHQFFCQPLASAQLVQARSEGRRQSALLGQTRGTNETIFVTNVN
jgi:hypothetical protein